MLVVEANNAGLDRVQIIGVCDWHEIVLRDLGFNIVLHDLAFHDGSKYKSWIFKHLFLGEILQDALFQLLW